MENDTGKSDSEVWVMRNGSSITFTSGDANALNVDAAARRYAITDCDEYDAPPSFGMSSGLAESHTVPVTYLVADSSDSGGESYDTIETPAAWLTVCAWAASAYHWFHRLVWCRRSRHAWVDTETCVYVQSRYSVEEFCYLAECKHCESCRWVRLSYPALVVDGYSTYDAAMRAARNPHFKIAVQNARKYHV